MTTLFLWFLSFQESAESLAKSHRAGVVQILRVCHLLRREGTGKQTPQSLQRGCATSEKHQHSGIRESESYQGHLGIGVRSREPAVLSEHNSSRSIHPRSPHDFSPRLEQIDESEKGRFLRSVSKLGRVQETTARIVSTEKSNEDFSPGRRKTN